MLAHMTPPFPSPATRISLIGESPSRGRVLVELVEHDEQQRLAPCPVCSLSSNARRNVTPTTKRLARSCEVVQVDDRDLRVGGLDAVPARASATSARTSAVERALRRQQPAHERVDRARCRSPAPAHVGTLGSSSVTLSTMKSTRSRYVRSVCAVDPPAAVVAAGSPSRLQRGARRCARPSCTAGVRPRRRRTRTAAARPRRTPRSSRRSGCDADACGSATSGVGVRVALARRRVHRDRRRTRRASSPSVAVPVRAASSSSRAFVVVEEEEVFALHVEDQRLACWSRPSPSTPELNRRVEQEGGVRRLRRDAGDARDVDVRAARAVDEVEVGEQRLAVAAEPDRQLALHAVEEQRLVALVARAPGGPRAPGSGGTYTSGSTRVVVHLRGLDRLGRQHAVGDEEHVRVEARAFVAGPHLGDDSREPHRLVAPGHRRARTRRRRRAAGTGPRRGATQNVSGVASSVPSTRPTGWIAVMRATVAPG